MPIMDLRHANDACVGQPHRRVFVFLSQLAQWTDMLVVPERDTQRATLGEFPGRRPGPLGNAQEIHRLGEHRLADRNPGIDHAPRALGQPGEIGIAARFARSVKNEPQPLLDQVPELATAQRRLCLGSTVELVRNFDCGLH